MAENNSHFRKTIDLIKHRVWTITAFVFWRAYPIPIVLSGFVFPPEYYYDDIDEASDIAFGSSAILYVSLDALFLYVPLINEETKCVMLDNRLMITAIVLRSIGDLRYVLRIYLRIKRGLRESRRRQESLSLKKVAMSVANDTLSILPVPQVVILIFLPKMRGSRSLKIMKFLNSLILLQYLLRLYPIIKMCTRVNKYMLDLFEDKIKKKQSRAYIIPKGYGIVVNIFGYILASHVLGAFWYFFSIQREIDCWGYACRIENGCEFSTLCVEKTFRNITFIQNVCPIKGINPSDATVFNFGIFLYALQSGMQRSTNFPEKLFQCFSWGLRNLSSFASNLESSTYGWENLFVVVTSISGLILFMYLLGHSQTYMQEIERLGSVKQKMTVIVKPKIQSLLSDYRLPSKMQRNINRAVELILERDKDFIVENMFSILSFSLPEIRGFKERLDSEIKCNLFLDKLKKVEGLKDKDEKVLITICEHLEPMIYTEEKYIIREGEPLDKMFFVTQGNVLTFATNNGGSSCSSATIQLVEQEEDCWYGEELLTWAKQPSSKLSTLPISPVTVKSHNKVEVFALKALKALKALNLQNVVSESLGNVIEIESGQ